MHVVMLLCMSIIYVICLHVSLYVTLLRLCVSLQWLREAISQASLEVSDMVSKYRQICHKDHLNKIINCYKLILLALFIKIKICKFACLKLDPVISDHIIYFAFLLGACLKTGLTGFVSHRTYVKQKLEKDPHHVF